MSEKCWQWHRYAILHRCITTPKLESSDLPLSGPFDLFGFRNTTHLPVDRLLPLVAPSGALPLQNVQGPQIFDFCLAALRNRLDVPRLTFLKAAMEGRHMYVNDPDASLHHAGKMILPLFVFVMLSTVSAIGQDLTQSQIYLEFDQKPVLQQGTVTFVRSYPDPVSAPMPSDKDGLVGYSDDGAFKLVVDRQSIRFDQYGNYTFTVFANPLKAIGGFTFYLRARPQGTFGDLEDSVHFHLHHEGKDSSGMILLPLHAVGSSDLLEPAKPILLPETIKLSGVVRPSIRLRSTLPNFALQVMQTDVTSECSDCWKDLAPPVDLGAGGPGRTLTAKGQDTEILLTGRARAWPSLLTSLGHFKMSDPHDNLTLRVTYAPVEGGRIRTQDFVIPVRFSPSIWEVAALMIVGMAVGILLRRALGQADAFARRQIAIVAGTVIASELILYVSVSETHPLVLFGFNADPTQPLTIFLIALLVSGGPRLTTSIAQVTRDLWNLVRGTQPNNPDPGGHDQR
jgi:hypothetical protein